MSTRKPLMVPIKRPKVIAVEGKEDRKLFDAFIRNLHLRNIQVVAMGGRHPLTKRIESVKNTPGFSQVTSFGVVIDADRNYQAAFQSLCAALRNINLAVPTSELTKVGNSPSVVLMVLPKRGRCGTLEDLCLNAVRSDPAIPCVNRYFACLSRKGINTRNISKAKIRAFLSSRPKADLTIGDAAYAGYWPFLDSTFDDVRRLLQMM